MFLHVELNKLIACLQFTLLQTFTDVLRIYMENKKKQKVETIRQYSISK